MVLHIFIGLSLTNCRYGFVKFHNFKDAETCIRGFHHCGYETSFARVRIFIASILLCHAEHCAGVFLQPTQKAV